MIFLLFNNKDKLKKTNKKFLGELQYNNIFTNKNKTKLSEKNMFVLNNNNSSYLFIKEFIRNNLDLGLVSFCCCPGLIKKENAINAISEENWIRELIEEGFSPKNIILAGIRKFCCEEEKIIREKGINCFSRDELFLNIEETGDDLYDSLRKFEKIHLSLNLNVLDPAFVPDIKQKEPNGLIPSEFFYLLKRVLILNNIKSIDIVLNNDEDNLSETSNALLKKILELIQNRFEI